MVFMEQDAEMRYAVCEETFPKVRAVVLKDTCLEFGWEGVQQTFHGGRESPQAPFSGWVLFMLFRDFVFREKEKRKTATPCQTIGAVHVFLKWLHFYFIFSKTGFRLSRILSNSATKQSTF